MLKRALPALLGSALMALAAPAPRGELPGRDASGATLLPSGWRLAPAGRHLDVGDLPMALLESPDGRYLIVASEGYQKPTLTVIDLAHQLVRSTLPLDDAWLGLAWHPDGQRLFSSGGGTQSVKEIAFSNGSLSLKRTVSLPKPSPESFVAGVSLSPDGARLYAVHALGERLTAVDVARGEVVRSRELPAEGFSTLVSADGASLFVSLWGGARVLLFDPQTLEPRGEIPVGEHPGAMALSADGARLFVACANTNAVDVVDVAAREARERVSVALYPGAPPGSTPSGLGLSPDGRTLLVANSDNNALAWVDVSRPGASRVQGFIPTGWYPTAASFSRDGRSIFVLSGKGLSSSANPRHGHPGIPGAAGQYAGSMFTGTVSIVPTPDPAGLARYTEAVRSLTPYADSTRLAPPGAPRDSPIPATVGGASPIRHVFYIIRENRSYDQILGDLGRGNGDPSLCLFGADVTPNAHALAREFVVLDNFYVNAEVSYDGHAFSTGAYANDFVERVWPMNYGHRGARYLSEGRGTLRNAYGNITAPPAGYLWDAAERAGVTVRSYGEFAFRGENDEEDPGEGEVQASVPGLKGRVHPGYPPWNLQITDNRRADIWLEEFHAFEARGGLPQLSIIRLPGDHTAGTRPGYPTPRAMIAENDLALGRMVEAITRSSFWKDSAIFVLEDDAQDGPDHVDAHRSVAFAISPYARRGAVDSTLYTTTGMLRTMELILGLPPMTQYDGSATPLYGAFQAAPAPAPFVHRPPGVPLDETNQASAYGAAASMAMDFDGPDRAPARELNEILWRSVRGPAAAVPPPVRAAFVSPAAGE